MTDAPKSRTITVLVVDDNAVVRAVLRDMLHAGVGIEVVAEAQDGHEALRLATSLSPQVTLLDHRMPARDGLSVVSAIGEHSRVLMLTRSAEDDVVLRAVHAGALGFLIHGQFTPAELIHAVHAVAGGEAHLSPSAARVLLDVVRQAGIGAAAPPDPYGLSPREREVMEMMVNGLSNSAIAENLVLAPKTVENHVNHIFAKLGVGARSEAISVWKRRNVRARPGRAAHP